MKKYMFITLILLTGLRAFGQDDGTTLTSVGQIVPNFSITTIDGKNIKISELRGKIVLINFFATWCGPCMSEMPKIENDIWRKLKSDKFLVLAIGREHTKDELISFNRKNKFTFNIAPDPKREVYGLFAKSYIPRNYVISKDGRILFQSMGYSPEEFEKMIQCIKGGID